MAARARSTRSREANMRSTQSTLSGKPRLTTSSMIASIAAEGQKTKSAPFGHALVDLARARSDVIGMTADLGKYTDLHIFAKEFPDRYYQMGMAEQLLFGAANLIRNGKDSLISSSGIMTMRALEAAKALVDDRVDVGVLHVPTIKPLDAETILREAGKSGRLVVVAENHTVIGGLGEAVAGLLMRSGIYPTFRQIGLPDEFLDAGALPTLHDRYGISATAVAKQIRGWL